MAKEHSGGRQQNSCYSKDTNVLPLGITDQTDILEKMTVLDLPIEMLLSIAEEFDSSRDILSFARVNKRAYGLLRSALYKFNIQQQNASALHWAACNGRPLMAKMMLQRYLYDVNAVYCSNTPLIYAVFHGSTTVAHILLANRHIDVNFQNKRGQCALWWAARRGGTDIVERLLQRDDVQVDNRDLKDRLTPLGVAVLKGHERIARHLLNTGRVDVNARNRQRRTPIFHALSRDDRTITEMLLADESVDLSCQDVCGRTPLMYSVLKGRTELTKLLLGHSRPYVDVRDSKDLTALWYAVRMGNEEIVQHLLEGHSTLLRDANHGIGGEQALLCLAAYLGKDKMVQLFLDHGWDVNEVDAQGRTPLHLAAQQGHFLVAQVLLNRPQINLRAQEQWGSTALHEAAKRGHLAVIELLLAKPGIAINIEDVNGAHPLWWATKGRHNDVAARLLDEPNISVNAIGKFEAPEPDSSTCLHHAVQAGAMEIVRKLLAVRALNPNVGDHQKWTPLCWAANQGNVEMVELLLTRPDIRVNGVEGKEAPPLCLAAREGQIQVVRRLLQWPGIDINQQWGAYLPPLLAAITNGHSNVAMYLLGCGKRLDVNAQTYAKESALSLAARQGDLQVVESLLRDYRTDCKSVDDRGRTALWWAAHTGQKPIVERLLADDRVLIDVADDEGIDALNAARRQYHFNTARLLRAHRPGHHSSSDGFRHPATSIS
ncbi:hypothetical protein Asppvi_002052 [Aspergillus pseudoviridinutans]|uniref:Ankyrin repeat-containing domain protein n=1 Tax=Aspergillus pseudoviridinutans TaxID=1517512 RepID=A0A9P3BRM9_9EURO|nr:uncharacterized protein Asppvi_002052 [Aspergillus pseudoviridinutans]GIJ92774.1 hypothetical protein Asppvi_002052 [Aspergillus pseudoviridinutans]